MHWPGGTPRERHLDGFGHGDAQQAGAAVKTIVPSESIFLMLNSIGIMKDAPNPAGALAFLKFFLSDDMQNIIMNQLGISVAVDSNVKVTNTTLADGLGGKTPAEVLQDRLRAGLGGPGQDGRLGPAPLSSLYSEIAEVARIRAARPVTSGGDQARRLIPAGPRVTHHRTSPQPKEEQSDHYRQRPSRFRPLPVRPRPRSRRTTPESQGVPAALPRSCCYTAS